MISDTAKGFIKAKIEAERQLLPLRSTIAQVNSDVESPVDYVKSQFKTMPLAADSMNMGVQYFSFDSNSQSGRSFANTIAGYVSSSTSFPGETFSEQATTAARSQVSKQVSEYDILGTLVVSVVCTHKNALVMAPYVINPDKAIKCWNHLKIGKPLDPTSEQDMATAIEEKDDEDEPSFSILSGTTFGSSFIGMVHILNNSETKAAESLVSFAASAQAQLDVGAWFEKESGGFGVNTSFSNNVKDLLSSQSISSHVTLICMGVIPSIVASDVQLVSTISSQGENIQRLTKLDRLSRNSPNSTQPPQWKKSPPSRTRPQRIRTQSAKQQQALVLVSKWSRSRQRRSKRLYRHSTLSTMARIRFWISTR